MGGRSSSVRWRFSKPLPPPARPQGRCGRPVGQRSFLPTSPSSPVPTTFDFSCLEQPCPSSPPPAKELDLHGIGCIIQYHLHRLPDPRSLQYSKAELAKRGLGSSEPSPAPLYSVCATDFVFLGVLLM